MEGYATTSYAHGPPSDPGGPTSISRASPPAVVPNLALPSSAHGEAQLRDATPHGALSPNGTPETISRGREGEAGGAASEKGNGGLEERGGRLREESSERGESVVAEALDGLSDVDSEPEILAGIALDCLVGPFSCPWSELLIISMGPRMGSSSLWP